MTRQPLEKLEAGLPAAWYRDPAHYQRELEAFWYSRWIAVAREEELPQPGDWRVVRIGTQSLVVLRADGGELRAIHNTCRHRGSVLCTEESGNFARQRIVCAYHSWTYDLAGRLVAEDAIQRGPRQTGDTKADVPRNERGRAAQLRAEGAGEDLR